MQTRHECDTKNNRRSFHNDQNQYKTLIDEYQNNDRNVDNDTTSFLFNIINRTLEWNMIYYRNSQDQNDNEFK